MSKFNQNKEATTNLAGGKAYKESAELELVSLLLTSFVEDKFYESADSQLTRLTGLAEQIKDKTFLAKVAIYARNEFGMRSITHALAGEIVRLVKGEEWVKRAIEKIVYRPDDMSEILAYYVGKYGKPIPNSLKKGLARAFGKFDAYSLGKYRCENKDIKLVDIVNLVHPMPSDKNRSALEQLVAGTLTNKLTWESKLTSVGQETDEDEKNAAKGRAWDELLREKKLGYMALIRNIRNIEQYAGTEETLKMLCESIENRDAIIKSKVFPFTIAGAMQYANNRNVLASLSKALDYSLSNIPQLPGKTCIVLDTSGSMSGKPSAIGSLFASAFYKALNADIVCFSDNARFHTPNPTDSISTIQKSINFACGGTDFGAPIQLIIDEKKEYDRIIVLSDMQGWSGNNSLLSRYMKEYKRISGKDPFIYSFDLNGYGTLEFPQNKVICLAGFSEKIFDVMSACEEDKNALLNKIKTIEI
jgi:hypothetical protein